MQFEGVGGITGCWWVMSQRDDLVAWEIPWAPATSDGPQIMELSDPNHRLLPLWWSVSTYCVFIGGWGFLSGRNGWLVMSRDFGCLFPQPPSCTLPHLILLEIMIPPLQYSFSRCLRCTMTPWVRFPGVGVL